MRYHKITGPDIENGLGCRITLWIAGCSHKCKGCHNPETWSFKSGKPFDDKAKEELFEKLSYDYIKGLTLSGGDPIDSFDDTLALVKEVKEKFPDKDIWLYTGYRLDEMILPDKVEIMKYIDYLVEGRFIEQLLDLSLAFRGSRNQNIIHILPNGELENVSLKLDNA